VTDRRALHGALRRREDDVLFIGPRGVGKATLAVALELKAVHAGYRAYYMAAADLIDRTA
jgi:DNA replication protein DnaC